MKCICNRLSHSGLYAELIWFEQTHISMCQEIARWNNDRDWEVCTNKIWTKLSYNTWCFHTFDPPPTSRLYPPFGLTPQ